LLEFGLTVKALVALFCLSLFVRVCVLTVKALVALFCLSLFVRVCDKERQNRATKSFQNVTQCCGPLNTG
jgi:Flp pilus assembly protein TadB